MEHKRTQEDWMRLHDSAVCAILNGRCANDHFGEMSMSSLVGEALTGADLLVEKLREREEDNSEEKCI